MRSDLVGQTFNRLECLQYVSTDKRGNARYLWKCNCGTEKEIDGSKVKTGITVSCGYIAKESAAKRIVPNKLDPGEASFNMYYRTYRDGAKNRNREFELTKQEFKEISKRDCVYCGEGPRPVTWNKRMNGPYVGNGIDRADNTKGYIKDNVVTCCSNCNIMKSNKTKEEFFNHIKKIYNLMEKTNGNI